MCSCKSSGTFAVYIVINASSQFTSTGRLPYRNRLVVYVVRLTSRKPTINARDFIFGFTRSSSVVYTSNDVYDFTSYRVIRKLDANTINSYYVVRV